MVWLVPGLGPVRGSPDPLHGNTNTGHIPVWDVSRSLDPCDGKRA
jgi:hypothetical protein